MLQLKVKEIFLDLNTNTIATITMVNPVFDAEHLARAFSYQFNIPATPLNLSTLGYINRLDSSKSVKKVDAELWIMGTVFDKGKLKIVGVNEKGLKVHFQNSPQTLLEDLEAININEILPTIQVPQTLDGGFWQLEPANPPGDYSVQINSNTYTLSLAQSAGMTTKPEVINHFIPLINADYPGTASQGGSNLLELSDEGINPYEVYHNYLNFTLISSRTVMEAQQSNLLSLADDIIDTPVESYAFPMHYNPGFYRPNNSFFESWINYWHDAQKTNTPRQILEWEHTYVPMVRLPYLLKQIVAQAGLTDIEGDWWDITDSQQLVIYNNKALDEARAEQYAAGMRYLNGFVQSFDLNDHVLEISCKDLLLMVATQFALYLDTAKGSLFLNKKKAQLDREAIDWTSKVEPEFNFDLITKEGFELKYNTDENEKEYFDDQLTNKTITEGDTPFNLPFWSLYETVFSDNGETLISARQDQQGFSAVSGNEGEYTLRLLFDRGKHKDSGASEDYNQTGHKTLDIHSTSIGTYSLAWDGDDGLYEQFHKNVLELTQKPIITKIVRLHIGDITKMREWEQTKVLIIQPEGQVIGIVRQVQFKVSNRKTNTILATVQIVKL